MIWSKSNRALKLLLADSLKDRVQYHMTRYGNGVSHYMTRAWVTWDGKEIANMSTIKAEMEGYENLQRAYLVSEMIEKLPAPPAREDFERAVKVYLDTPSENSRASADPLVQALARFDQPSGWSGIGRPFMKGAIHPLIQEFFKQRAEKLPNRLTRGDFERAVEVYLDAPIDASLASDDPVVKALAMFDRRVGKRRLTNPPITEADHLLVKQFYALRCEAEGIRPAELTA